MKLHGYFRSSASYRVRIALNLKGLSADHLPHHLRKGEQRDPAYLAINPQGLVPTLQDDQGAILTQSLAIIEWLEEIHPEPPLLGITPKTKAQVAMWERRVEMEGFASVMEVVRNAVPGLKGRAIAGPHDYEQIPALAERSRQRVGNFYADFNARLADVPFMAGDEFSVADITALVTVDFATKAAELPIGDERTALKRWYERVSARASVGA